MDIDRSKAVQIIQKASANGGRFSETMRMHWDVSNDCLNPRHIELTGRDERHPSHGLRKPVFIDMTVQCRKCENCRARKAAHWRMRAVAELKAAEVVNARTWFVTLTLKPSLQFEGLSRARMKAKSASVNWEDLHQDDRFLRLASMHGDRITRYLKRLRTGDKQSGPHDIRYLLVAEAHKSGMPHFHMLMHEKSADNPVRKSSIQRFWKDGYSSAKLVRETGVASYVTKYITKSCLARVRASKDYGNYVPEPSSLPQAIVTRHSLEQTWRERLLSRTFRAPAATLDKG